MAARRKDGPQPAAIRRPVALKKFNFAEALDDAINEAVANETDTDEIISELELKIMALKEEAE